MAGFAVASARPRDGWEILRDAARSRVRAALDRRPGLRSWLRRAQWALLWGGLALLLVLAAFVDRYRAGLQVYACCFFLLVLWFAVARTRTVTWAGVARMFAIAGTWSWGIAWLSARLARAAGFSVGDVGAGTAIAAIGEESLKLVPLIALVLIAPRRVRRFATVDWLLLGLASGLGFQAWEDLLRRLARSVSGTGIFDFLFDSSDPHGGQPQYGLGLLSGGSAYPFGDDIVGYAGHHVFTGLVAGCVGLGIAAWRASRGSRTAAGLRVLALALPVVAWIAVTVDHFGFNAALRNSGWAEGERSSAPGVLRLLWVVTGKGTGVGWLLLACLVACLLVDAQALHASGSATDLELDGWYGSPRRLADRWAAAVPRLNPIFALLCFAGRDLAVVMAAHHPAGGESRATAITRGRAASVLVREIRTEALASRVDQPSDDARVPQRLRVAVALGAGAFLLVACATAVLVARRIGADLTPDSGLFSWLAGQFDALARWWAARSLLEKIVIGAAIAALVALSGGSLALAFGVSGAATYLAEHGAGAATFLRDPTSAGRSWWQTTTPAGMALDLAEFGLTFLPGNLFGGLTGRQLSRVLRAQAVRRLIAGGQIRDLASAVPGSVDVMALHAGSADRAVLKSIFRHEYSDIEKVNAANFARKIDGHVMNCTQCVIATDRSLAGMPSVAAPVYTKGAPITVVSKELGRQWVRVSHYADVVSRMERAGAGARGVVFIDPRGEKVGHVFNVIHDSNGIVFIDGQTGFFANLTEFDRLYFLRSK